MQVMSKTLLSVSIGNPCGSCITLAALSDAVTAASPAKSQTLLAMAPDACLSFAMTVDAAFGEVVTSVDLNVRDSRGTSIYRGNVQGPIAPGAALLPVTLLRQADVATSGLNVVGYSVRIWTVSKEAIHSYVAEGPGSDQLRTSEG